LIALSIDPVVAGTFRLVQFGGCAEIAPKNAPFFAAPLPVVLHIVSATIYCALGAFKFCPRLSSSQSRLALHRRAGLLLVLGEGRYTIS
jgi:hypothetical protein